jgi:dienelactone hydrolase
MAPLSETLVSITLDDVVLEGALEIPEGATGLVVFVHGSGSSRKSPRNNYVAHVLRDRRLGTLLFDLLTEVEDRVPEARFDIPLLSERLGAVTQWLGRRPETTSLRVGYFGASTGAAAALQAASRAPSNERVGAIVSRGGRVDMAPEALPDVQAPCLFIVGGADTQVRRLNQEAYAQLTCTKAFHVVEGAGHLFRGRGELEEVAQAAADWFAEML